MPASRVNGLASATAYGSSVSLVVDSGIQFLDFDLAGSVAEATFGRFTEDADILSGTRQPMLCEVALEDGLAIHPITRQPVLPHTTYRIGGMDALQAFAEHWVPLPLLRVVGRHATGEPRYDEGPMNWVRGHLTRLEQGGGLPASYRLVLAIDTRLEHDSRSPDKVYNAPCRDDVRFQSSFALVDRADDVAWLLGEDWLDAWLRALVGAAQVTDAEGRPKPTSDFALAHMAHYLVLLRVIRAAAQLPDVRFLDTVSPRTAVTPDDVDLVIDVGHRRTLAVVADVDPRDGTALPGTTRMLSRRDLSEPSLVHAGAFPTRLEFHQASFGDEALSRRSGRIGAFEWPGIARVGDEAQRLAELAVGLGDATGLAELRHGLLDTSPVPRSWRFSAEARAGVRGSIVSGRILSDLTEAGDVQPDAGHQRAPALRARFSPSAMMSLFLAEIIAQAVAAINAPSAARKGSGVVPRRLRRIILAGSFSASAAELEMLELRARGAVDLAFRMLASEPSAITSPAPVVTRGCDRSLAAQVLTLVDTAEHKLKRPLRELFEWLGRPRAGFGPVPCLRIASLDIGAVRTSATVVTHMLEGTTISPRLELSDGCDYGADDVLDIVSQRVVMPAIERHMTEAGVADAHGFFRHLSGQSGDVPPADQQVLRGLIEFVARPAARAVLHHAAFDGWRNPNLPMLLHMGRLLQDQSVDPAGVPRMFSGRVGVLASAPFDLRDVVVTTSVAALNAIIAAATAPLLGTLGDLVDALDCDLIHLSGSGFDLPFVTDAIVSSVPVRPDRIIRLRDRITGTWYPLSDSGRRPLDDRCLGLVGLLLVDTMARTGLPFGLDLTHLEQPSASRALLLDALGRERGEHVQSGRAQAESADPDGIVAVSDVLERRRRNGEARRGGR